MTLHLGGHLEDDFLEADLLVVNPAVPKDSPLLAAAGAAGVPCTTEINLFLERCRAPVVGRHRQRRQVHHHGHDRRNPPARAPRTSAATSAAACWRTCDDIRPDHVVVLELSSFQLEDLPLIGVSPHVAVVTNLCPNHLDRHGTMAGLRRGQEEHLPLPEGRRTCWSSTPPTRSSRPGRPRRRAGWSCSTPAAEPFELTVPGGHNQANAQAAWAAARQFGVDRATAGDGAGGLRRACRTGSSSSPSAAACGTTTTPSAPRPTGPSSPWRRSPPRSAVIIVGGYDKHVGFDALGQALAAPSQGRGRPGPDGRADRPRPWRPAAATRCRCWSRAEDLDSAVQPGGRPGRGRRRGPALPACASFDMFTNYEHRGQAFVDLVMALPE